VTSLRVYFVLPGRPETPTGGFVYDRHMLSALRANGRLAGCLVLPGNYPEPSTETRAAAGRALRRLPDGVALIVDGLAFSPLLDAFAAEAGRLRLYALIHHPLCDESGLAPAERARLLERERQALALARGVVVTSRHTALRLADLGVPADRLRVVHPGVDSVRRRRPASSGSGAPVLLCVASLTPRKGQDVLLRALARLRRLVWRLLLVGPARDAAFAGRLRRLAHDLRIDDRVDFLGVVNPTELARIYLAVDLFMLPSHHEGYGIAVAEAGSYGLPVIASDAGAIAEAVSGARHRLVLPGDVAALADALRSTLSARPTTGGRWRAPVDPRPRSWATAGREFIAALDDLLLS
jgi:glycosyltransferase involved in cell wall biosynthesis